MRTRTALTLLSAITLAFSLSGCGSSSSRPSDSADKSSTSSDTGASTSSRPDYNNTKAMMMDILHSQQGKQALKEILQDPAVKQSLSISQQDINQALTKAITSGPNNNLIQNQMKDPKFASVMIKAAKKEHQDLLKTLVKDPEYQNQLLALMKSPSYQQTLIPLMQTPECRQAIMKVMMDSLQNPEFKLMYMDTVKEAIRSGAGVSQQPSTASAGGQDASKSQSKTSGQDSKSSKSQDQQSSSDSPSSDQDCSSSSKDKKSKTASQDNKSDGQDDSDSQGTSDQQTDKKKKDQSDS